MDLQDWQIRQIEEGLREADSGDFASDEEVAEFFAKWIGPRGEAEPTEAPSA
jgi:RHH-type transcriptional regulator, rel operon repressor / antitoxin RelB